MQTGSIPLARPNILLLMTDQQRFDSLGCYGAAFAHTPNLDRLAGEGALFEHCYVNNPICTPSRACMFTGKHVHGHGVSQLYDTLPGEEVLFTKRLQSLGYTTALFGKLHVSSIHTETQARHPNDGFDVYEPCLEGCLHMDAPYQAYARWLEAKAPSFYARMNREGRKLLHPPLEFHMTHWAAERSIDFLHRHANSGAPFFCMMSIFEPHNPYEHYPEEMGTLVDPDAIPDPLATDLTESSEPSAVRRERHGSYLGDIDTFSAEAIKKMRHGYHASVAYADLEFGRVLDTLDELGLTKDTLVIFVSDHGDMLGDRRLLVKGAFFYDANVRVPLLMRWPAQFEGGRRIPGLVQNHDLAATVLSAVGMERDAYAAAMPDAFDLLSLATGAAGAVHDEAYCCYRNSGIREGGFPWDPPIHGAMIRDARYKLNLWHDALDTQVDSAGELYDMEEDPDERRNLWDNREHGEIQDRLARRLWNWITR